MITLKQYTNEEAQIIPLIQGFWKAHSHYDQSEAEALEDLQNWTKQGHLFYPERRNHSGLCSLGKPWWENGLVGRFIYPTGMAGSWFWQ